MRDADILERLGELGLELPALPEPVASYVPVKRAGALAFVAGQVAMVDGRLLHPGRLGQHVSVEMGQEAAARAGLQALSAIRDHLGGSLDRLVQILQVTVYVAADAEFIEHPTVANGASDALVAVLGPEGRHARAAVGVASLPLGACVEVAVTAEVSEESDAMTSGGTAGRPPVA
jgi:enamine deaminase RidA (YjgF/YER057c/UK114 family)